MSLLCCLLINSYMSEPAKYTSRSRTESFSPYLDNRTYRQGNCANRDACQACHTEGKKQKHPLFKTRVLTEGFTSPLPLCSADMADEKPCWSIRLCSTGSWPPCAIHWHPHHHPPTPTLSHTPLGPRKVKGSETQVQEELIEIPTPSLLGRRTASI